MVQLPMLQLPALFPQQDPPPSSMHVQGGEGGCTSKAALGRAVPEPSPKRQKLLLPPINLVAEPGSKASATRCFMDLLQGSLDTGFTFMPVGCAEAHLGSSASPVQLPEPTSPSSGMSSGGSPVAIRHGCTDAPGFPPQTPCSAPADPTFQPTVKHAADAAAVQTDDMDLEPDLMFDVDVDALLDMAAVDGFILPEPEAEGTHGTMPWHTEPECQARSLTPSRGPTPVRSRAHAAHASTVPLAVPGWASPACILMVPAAFPAADTADGSETMSTAQAHKHTVTSGIQGRADRALAFFTQQVGASSNSLVARTSTESVSSTARLSQMAVDATAAVHVPDAAGLGGADAMGDLLGKGDGAQELPVDPLPEADSAVRHECWAMSSRL